MTLQKDLEEVLNMDALRGRHRPRRREVAEKGLTLVLAHHAEIAQNAEAVVTLREELEDYKNAALHSADDLRAKDAEIAQNARRLAAFEQAISDQDASGGLCMPNWIIKRADEIMRGGELTERSTPEKAK